ncbi:GntR family transcriptional regulator [Anaerosporomusa subterranea]|uniref:GntR family transcriptional regulator n=1 Tax=Anaerosporomusa subterranea TaxID=1794912 RepID=A0A154BMY8_ANASB|nr:PLP-dependent aminotransferase family protein [Anaerosporomusa subterranea]KYZ75245.1 GntR family transcriptional regulator [Anaerosporomusa subterranea]
MFILDCKDRRPLHVKIYNQIKNQILSGKLIPNTKLPSIRNLSVELSVSRNTVEYAYEQLYTEGFIYSRPRSGYYVSLLDQEYISRPCRKTATLIEPAFGDGKTFSFDFHPACLSPESFPGKIWSKLLTNCLQENPEQFTLYCDPQGEFDLRYEIQRYLERFRGVSCDPEQIVVCCGLQDSMSILAQILLGNHSAFAFEDPGHWIPRSVFQNYSFLLNPIPVNSDGISLDYLKKTNSTVIHVTPSHQFPLGNVMPVENRLRLINWAENVGGVIIEDDYDSELRYHGKPIPALQGLHPEGDIIYVGTFSKVLSPALRASYMVLPYRLLSIYNKLFRNYAATVSLLEQRALYKFMRQGYWERHLRKMRTMYKKKHDALIQSIDRHFGDQVKILGQGAGLHVVLELANGFLDEKDLISRAWEKNVRMLPLSDTYQCKNYYPTRVMLGFGRMNPDELEKGIELLSQAWNL